MLQNIRNLDPAVYVGDDEPEGPEDRTVVGGKDRRRDTLNDIQRLQNDVLSLIRRVLDHPVDHCSRIISSTFDIDIDRGHCRFRHIAQDLVIVHTYDSDIERYLQTADVTGLDQNVSLVVIAGHNSYRLRQRHQPFVQGSLVIIPEVVNLLTVIQIHILTISRLCQTPDKALITLVRPANSLVAEECKVLEALAQKVLCGHFSRKIIVRRHIRNLGKFGNIVLRDRDDSVLSKKSHVVVRLELTYDDICVPRLRPRHHAIDAELAHIRRWHLADHPLLCTL